MKFMIPTLVLAAAVALPLSALAAEEVPAGKSPSPTGAGPDPAGPGGKTRAERYEGVPQDKSKGTRGQAGEGRYFDPAKKGEKAAAPAGAPTFKGLDTNNDGYISREEAKSNTGLASRFKTLDKDGDGKLSPGEYGNWSQKPAPIRGQAGEGAYFPPKK